MLETVLTFGPPVILVVGMIGVGLSMTRPVVLSVAARPAKLVAMTCLQAVLLPLAGMAVVLVTDPVTTVASAILLIAACPGGGISNLYVLFARANTSLSVLMTLTGIALVSLTLPALLAAMQWLGFKEVVEGVDTMTLALKLLGVIAIPVSIGMLIRSYAPALAHRWEERMRSASFVMILMILLAVLWLERATVLTMLSQMVLSAAAFLGLALALGAVVGFALYAAPGDRFAVMTEFGVRNLAIGTFVAVGVQGDLSFAGTAAVYLLLEAVALFAMGIARRTGLSRLSGPLEGAPAEISPGHRQS